ncbi:MAG TPA: 3-phosphoshikimate 1-carboxyvinyltransferase [Chitinophagaceae bacterium]|nr:3-phosphoshikimate 1-carboxyvinyltransferase [Chitinophagaceae bacterium]
MIKTIIPSAITGELRANPSKSAMQRAVALSMLARGKSIIRNPGQSQDGLAALQVAGRLGALIRQFEDRIEITGNGVDPQISEINCGESGLSIRMFTPLAAICARPLVITGQGSLALRPMHFFEKMLPALGVSCQTTGGRLPIRIKGPLRAGNIEVDGSLSSQFLTGLLMAFGAVADQAEVRVRNLKSKPYIGLTLELMAIFGVKVVNDHFQHFVFEKKQRYVPTDYTVEGDWSGAAFLLVAGAVSGHISVSGLRTDSAQSDKAILQALENCRANVRVGQQALSVSTGDLRAFDFDATDCPDLFPPLVALAAHCQGTSTISGVSRLAHKESDRGKTLQQEFATLGIGIALVGDQMRVTGGKIRGARVDSHQDHRIAMACAVAGLTAGGPVVIDGAEAVNKSYPEFWDHLRSAGVNMQ